LITVPMISVPPIRTPPCKSPLTATPPLAGGHRARPLGDGSVAEVGRLIVLGMAGRFQHLRQPGEQVLIRLQ